MRRLAAALCVGLLAFAGTASAREVSIASPRFSPELAASLATDLGDREGAVLQRTVELALAREIRARGGEIVTGAPVTVETTIVEARESRPTFGQLTRRVYLDAFSHSAGGAELVAVLRDANGRELTRIHHRYYEDIFTSAPDTWGDANYAINQFAARVGAAYRNLGV